MGRESRRPATPELILVIEQIDRVRALHDRIGNRWRSGWRRIAWGTSAGRLRDLAAQPKGDPVKVEIARQLRSQTPMTRPWIAQRLRMGSAGYLSQLLEKYDDLKVCPLLSSFESGLDRLVMAILALIAARSVSAPVEAGASVARAKATGART